MLPPAPGTSPSGPAPGPRGGDPPGADDLGKRAAERFGPLELTRIHKDDGRALIFFSDAREQP